MYPIDEIKASVRWVWFKNDWAAADTIQKKAAAIVMLFNGWPDMTYPWRERAADGTLLPRGEPSYNRLLDIAVEKWGNYNDLRNWKNVLWREFWHLTGACFFFLPQYGLYCLARLLIDCPFVGSIGFALGWLPMLAFYWHKELVADVAGDGRFNAKNLIDLTMWHIPGIVFLLNLWL